MSEEPEEQAKLPKLNPLITLSKAPARDGTPSWTIHNPVSNEYFRIDWAEFECVARFSQHETAAELIKAVNTETTLEINESDIDKLVTFLNIKGLLALDQQMVMAKPDKQQALWAKIVHGYLFFTMPLIKPERFLQKTLPFIRPLLSKGFITLMMLVLALGVIATLQRIDEFFTTASGIFSAQGIILGLVVFAGLKILHEMSHAYTSTKYGVSVPHMGVAFIVMYPVLYTETTGSWQLSSRKQRLHIGMAGILAELCAAGVFLWIWNITPAGSIAQSVAFTAVVISLIGSLLVNLNPLMRFDGYYMLSDILGIDNMQGRACAFARWQIRRFLFALDDPAPEPLPTSQKQFLTRFGFALLIYRFFLFLGIAVLVYMVFPKPLGAFLMAVELLWFIGLPIWSELKIWKERKDDIIKTKRTAFTCIIALVALIFSVLPWQSTVSLPAVLHAEKYKAVYPPAESFIEDLYVTEGQEIKEGQVLALLSSETLEKNIKSAQQDLSALQDYRRRLQSDPAQARLALAGLDSEIALKEQELSNLQQQKDKLQIKAPFNGVIRDISPNIHEGRYVHKNELLFRVIDTQSTVITAFIDEQKLNRINAGNDAVFMPKFAAFKKIPVKVKKIDPTNTKTLPWAELSSLYGGPIPSNADHAKNGQISVVQGLYPVHLTANQAIDKKESFVKSGTVRIQGKSESALFGALRSALGLFIRESGLN